MVDESGCTGRDSSRFRDHLMEVEGQHGRQGVQVEGRLRKEVDVEVANHCGRL